MLALSGVEGEEAVVVVLEEQPLAALLFINDDITLDKIRAFSFFFFLFSIYQKPKIVKTKKENKT
jgi:hypothetical protein